MIETTPVSLFNRKAILGLMLAMVALLALCIGFLPIPFTILICYPPGIVCGIAALILGIQAQREIRQSNESGQLLALISAWIGGITIIATLCLITTGILLYPYISKFIQQVWGQINSH
jgi:FtsH-binding integral membrane protein